MATGIEIVGLILAIFPLITLFTNPYDISSSEELRFLRRTVNNEEAIFRDTLEQILSPHVEDARLQQLLHSRDADWSDEAIKNALEIHLGEKRFGMFQSIVNDIGGLLNMLRKELGLEDTPVQGAILTAKKMFKRVLKRLRSRQHKVVMEKLKTRVGELRKLAAIDRASSPPRRDGKIASVLHKFKTVRLYAASVYWAISRVWSCTECAWHCANLSLDRLLCGGLVPDAISDSHIRLRFSFSIASTLNGKSPDHWYETELAQLTDDVKQALQYPDNNDGLIRPYNPTTLSFLNSSVSLRNNNPINIVVPSQPLSRPQIKSPSKPNAEEIRKFCHFLKNHKDPSLQDGDLMGFLRDKQHFFGVYMVGKPKPMESSADFLKLTTVLSTRDRHSLNGKARPLGRRDRLKLAYTLTTAILQLYSTPWLEERWTRGDVLYLRVVEGITAGAPIETYVSRIFSSSGESEVSSISTDSTAAKASSDDGVFWIRNHTLYNLSLVLIELCFNKTIEDLAQYNEDGETSDRTPFYTAHRIINSDSIMEEYGRSYHRAVESCLGFVSSPNLEEDEVQQRFLTDVVMPLEEACKNYGVSLY